MAEVDNEKGAEAKAPKVAKSPSPVKLVIVGAVALFVALVGAQVAGPLINKALEGGSTATTAAEGEQAEDDELPEEEVADEPATPVGPALYVALDPPFVVSFDQEDGARYLQLTLQAMARSDKTIAAIKQHAPAIRNAFLFLLSSYEINDLTTVEGKEKLRAEMLVAANDVMAKNGGGDGVEELYFTSLVIQ